METKQNPTENSIAVPATFKVPKEFDFILDKMAPVLSVMRDDLREFVDSEDRVRFLKDRMSDYADAYVKMVKALRKGAPEEELLLETAIRIFGIDATYDLYISFRFSEMGVRPKVEFDTTTGKPTAAPKTVIPNAILLRNEFKETRYRDVAFITNIFDLLLALNEQHGVDKKKTAELIEKQLANAIKVSRNAIKLGKKEGALALEKYVVPAVLLKRSGRIIMSLLNNGYNEFARVCEEKDIRSAFGHLVEQRKFGISNNMASSFLAKFIPGFDVLSAAMLFFDYPHLIADRTRSDTYDLVNMCSKLTVVK